MSRCGTPYGYNLHRRAGEPACRLCKDAVRDYQRARGGHKPRQPARPRPEPAPRELQPCGTRAAYRRGCRCELCVAANREHKRESNERQLERDLQRRLDNRSARLLGRLAREIIAAGVAASKSCPTCGSHVGRVSGRVYCSPACRPGRRTSYVTTDGYRKVWIPADHPMAEMRSGGCQPGYVLLHRLIVALREGRPLRTDEPVHHLNWNKRDNRPANLYLCRDELEHSMIHWRHPDWARVRWLEPWVDSVPRAIEGARRAARVA